MKCPHCNDVVLTMSERQGVEIDYCSQCRGVWLDRGELDKLMEKYATAAAAPEPVYRQQGGQSDLREADHYPRPSGYGKHKQKSWLSEIFD